MHLGDCVLDPAPEAEAVAARLQVRLQDRLEHSLESGLHHAIAHGRDAQLAVFAAELGDHHFPHRLRTEPAGAWIHRAGEVGAGLVRLRAAAGLVVGAARVGLSRGLVACAGVVIVCLGAAVIAVGFGGGWSGCSVMVPQSGGGECAYSGERVCEVVSWLSI